MFKKNQPVKKRPETPPATQVPVLKYQRPKILLIDLDTVAKETLERDGYYVAAGTFGKPYRVPKGLSLWLWRQLFQTTRNKRLLC